VQEWNEHYEWAIAPPGQEGWREAPGWLFQIEKFCC
jgi:hypothetical protein